MRSSSSVESRSPQSRLSPCSVAAASLLPPPMPAATGMNLRSVMAAPPSAPVALCSARAARSTRLLSSAGTNAPPAVRTLSVSSFAGRIVI